ncbi:molecular chaperone HtpG [Methylosinus sporium]|uniref:Chaperone protein HtpG n=1 Tax=Methylosinus sporium TaxID=428 RepID=A0A549SUT5_METSR|nr:molecular chaperone HtpG [Methylosinus sporium]MBU3890238.1 molecular chaperone HtpG [Methylosinus sp. KRF6]TRL33395.1 molecular chaperone HtpG [Methylosinus sporium]
MNDHAETHTIDAAERSDYGFQADVARLLELMTHSVYSERDIFLRELVSNAADAIEKLRFESVANEALAAQAGAPLVTIALDKEARTLSVADNGVGMSREDLVAALGTIASSGTRAFLDELAAKGGDEQGGEKGGTLIGRFGIGFYSAFMVADRIEVATRRAGSADAFLWTSEGKGSFQIAPLAVADAPAVGTKVTLHLNAESEEFLEPYRIEQILREHSGAIAIPIDLVEEKGKEPRRLTDGSALWTRPKSEISEQDYKDFYQQISGQFDEPALTIHWRAEGRTEYTVLAFAPGSRPYDLFDPQRKSRSKLYVRRVLISREADLLPPWLRFMRIVVDSADLPLNVSREMVQNNPIIGAIRKAIGTRVLKELSDLAANDSEKFAALWKNFGAVIKEGLHEDPVRRDEIFAIARFSTAQHPDGGRSLKDYVENLRPNQTAIYYIAGDDKKRLAASPQLEGYRAKGIDVLLLDDPVDSFWVTSAVGYDGKPFKSVTQGAADIDAVPTPEGAADTPPAEASAEVALLTAMLKETLGGEVEDVRVSTRLRESPACLIAADHGFDLQLARMLQESGNKGVFGKPVLEINPRHEAVLALAQKAKADRAGAEDGFWLLFDTARIADGEAPLDAAAFAKRVAALLARA